MYAFMKILEKIKILWSCVTSEPRSVTLHIYQDVILLGFPQFPNKQKFNDPLNHNSTIFQL